MRKNFKASHRPKSAKPIRYLSTQFDFYRLIIIGFAYATCMTAYHPVIAQNVGIGEPFPQAKLHVNGTVRIDGDTLTGNLSSPATILHILSNGGVSVKLDANSDGNERFTIKKSGPDLGSVVFETTEAGNTTASGFGDFNGYGRFNGDFTLSGDSRTMFTGENFDVRAEGSIEF